VGAAARRWLGMTGKSSVRPADPCCFVVFGASGDLTHRLLIPALYNLAVGGLLPEPFSLVGVARDDVPSEAFRKQLGATLRQFATRPVDDVVADRLLACVSYVRGAADDPETYERLRQELERVESVRSTRGNRLFYLATPPGAFGSIGCHLGRSGLTREKNGAWRRLIVEKPYGSDLRSASALNHDLLQVLDEHQIYRIDHYLGKETVQNILVLRFAKGLFEPIWNRQHIDHVQITVADVSDAVPDTCFLSLTRGKTRRRPARR
jgi:glucose-6-phosphate 1-dehydrogenase